MVSPILLLFCYCLIWRTLVVTWFLGFIKEFDWIDITLQWYRGRRVWLFSVLKMYTFYSEEEWQKWMLRSKKDYSGYLTFVSLDSFATLLYSVPPEAYLHWLHQWAHCPSGSIWIWSVVESCRRFERRDIYFPIFFISGSPWADWPCPCPKCHSFCR